MFKIVKPQTDAQKSTHTTMDTIEITPGVARSWKLPPFQRPLRINDKVMELVEEIRRDEGVIPGILTLGVMDGDRYLVDGQHRREAFLLSEILTGYVDIRVLHVKDFKAMADEFYKLNSRIVNMRPDDYLRAIEMTNPALSTLRKRCPFVGFDMVRRGSNSPILSMSAVIRCWWASSKEVPTTAGIGVTNLADQFGEEECKQLVAFLELALAAWGRDPEFYRLWGNNNLTLCMWLYRRTVIGQYSDRTPKLTREIFQKCLMQLSSDSPYVDWLVGRNLNETNRAPTYGRIKSAFATRLQMETGKKPLLPQPAWSTHTRASR